MINKRTDLIYILLLSAACFLWSSFFLHNRGNFNYIQAAKRVNPGHKAEFVVWKYIGEPLKTGDILQMKARIVHDSELGRARLIITGDSDHNGIPDKLYYKSEWKTGSDHLSWIRDRITIKQNWNPPLYFGLQRPAGFAFWVEKTDFSFAPLENTFYYMSKNQENFRKGEFPLAGEILVDKIQTGQNYHTAIISMILTGHRWSGFFFPRMHPAWTYIPFGLLAILCMPSVTLATFGFLKKTAGFLFRRNILIKIVFFIILLIIAAGVPLLDRFFGFY